MIGDLTVSAATSLRDALDRIERAGMGVAFVVDDDAKLRGVVTDGDVRRGLLTGVSLDGAVSAVMTRDCVSLPVWSDAATIFARLSDAVRAIPLVDEAGRLVDYASQRRHHHIPVAEPSLTGREFEYVSECFRTNWISSQGPFVTRFEQDFAAYVGAAPAQTLTTANGTVALHLALTALGIGPGDEVIVPTLTFAASAAAVIHAGAAPVLADVEPDSWCLDPDAVEALITPRTKALMPVHLYGQPAAMDRLLDIAARHGLKVVEDAAEALGAFHRDRHVGVLGDAGAFSFFGNKLITTGEGGMVLFKDPAVAARARRLRDHGMDPERRYWHLDVGFNYRLTNLQAAVGVAQMERIEELAARKLWIAARYREAFADIPGLILPAETPHARNIYWTFSLLLDEARLGMSRDAFAARLKLAGVETRPLFFPLHVMPAYAQFGGGRAFPVAERLSASGLSLPSAVSLQEREIAYIAEVVGRLRQPQPDGVGQGGETP